MTTQIGNLKAVLAQYDHMVVVCDEQVDITPVASVVGNAPALAMSTSETLKSLDSVHKIYDFLLDQNASRKTLLVAIGGGVLTDMAGFAAATYMRGIDWVAIPTTLLAMVDASSGGKTGVNYGGLKNYIGAFHTPVEVYIDIRFLTTLPGEQTLSGYAEIVKTWLLDNRPTTLAEPDAITLDDILQAVATKENYVSLDPTEKGIRKALNLGHTVGHALEELSLTKLLHGYAVLYGLVAELYMSHVLLGLDKQYVSMVAHLVTEHYGRPNISCKQYDRIYELIGHDKKGSFTLLRAKGEPVTERLVSKELLYESLDFLFSI